jgi:hypothetical protein
MRNLKALQLRAAEANEHKPTTGAIEAIPHTDPALLNRAQRRIVKKWNQSLIKQGKNRHD